MLETVYYDSATKDAIGFCTNEELVCVWCVTDCFIAGEAVEEAYSVGYPDGFTCTACGVVFLPIEHKNDTITETNLISDDDARCLWCDSVCHPNDWHHQGGSCVNEKENNVD